MHNIGIVFGLVFCLLLSNLTVDRVAAQALSAERPNKDIPLVDGFTHPPDSARPWVYWFWLNGNITREGITADLEAMQRVGVGGGLFYCDYGNSLLVDCL